MSGNWSSPSTVNVFLHLFNSQAHAVTFGSCWRMRFITEGHFNNREKFAVGITLICLLLTGLVKIAEAGYVFFSLVVSMLMPVLCMLIFKRIYLLMLDSSYLK